MLSEQQEGQASVVSALARPGALVAVGFALFAVRAGVVAERVGKQERVVLERADVAVGLAEVAALAAQAWPAGASWVSS